MTATRISANKPLAHRIPAPGTLAAAALAILSAAMLSACTTASSVDRVAGMEAGGDAFTQALHGEYVALAYKEAGFDDWSDAGLFSAKAEAAAAGMAPPPEALEDWSIWDAGQLAQLTQARASLMDALAGGAGEASPALAARAQAAFDCWVEEAQEGPPADGPVADHQPQELAKCRNAHLAAMGEMVLMAAAARAAEAMEAEETAQMAVTLPPRPRAFTVYFAWDEAGLSPLTRSLLDDVAVEAQMQAPVSIAIAGYADTSGTADYNMAISRQRAEAVAAYLAAQGADSASFAVQWFGQEKLAVPTGDGMREEGNRRVEIVFE